MWEKHPDGHRGTIGMVDTWESGLFGEGITIEDERD